MALVRRWSVPGWARLVATITLSVYAACVGLVLFLDKQLKPSTWKWIHSATLIIWLVSILTALTFADNIRRAIGRHRAVSHQEHRVEIRNQMGALVITVARIHGLSADEIGCGLFLVQKPWLRRPRQWKPWFDMVRPERLKRVERLRLPDNVPESTVEFTKGKGAVGQCWEHAKHAHNDWTAINGRYLTPESVIARWDKMPEGTKRGFSQAEFIAMVGKYAEVLAVPIVIDGSFEGCIAIDRKWNNNGVADRSLFNDDATKDALGTTAKTLVPRLKKL